MRKILLFVTIAIVFAAAGITFVRKPSSVPETAETTETQVEDPVLISVADLHKVPEPKADGTLIGEFGSIFSPGTIYEILDTKSYLDQGIQMTQVNISTSEKTKVIAPADGTVSLSEKDGRILKKGLVGFTTSRIVVITVAAEDAPVSVEHNASVNRGDELMFSSGPCPEDKNATIIVIFYSHGLEEASKEDREKAMKDFLELLKLGAVNPGGL